MKGLSLARVCAAYLLAAGASGCTSPWEHVADLIEPTNSSNYARSIALDGNLGLVGSSGSVDLFARPPDNTPLPPHLWLEVQRFTPRPGAPSGIFAQAVAIQGGILAIGSPIGDPLLVDNGYVDVYEFQRASNSWTFLQTLIPTGFEPPPSFAPEILFGNAIAIAGNDLIVGAHHYEDTSGRVFVFERIAGSYQQMQILKPPTDVFETAFGQVIRLSGDTLAVSRGGGGGSGVGPGSPFVPGEVYIYVNSAGGWILQQVLTSPASQPQDFFGTGIDLHGDRLIVREETAVHMYERTAGMWNHIWDRPLAGGGIGTAVDLVPSTATTPAFLFAPVSGNVTTFVESVNQMFFTPDGSLQYPETLTSLGTDLAQSGDRVLVTGEDGIVRSVHVFELMVMP